MSEKLNKYFAQHIELVNQMVSDSDLLPLLDSAITKICNSYRNNGKVLFCGNGGSAVDAEHLAGELSGKFKIDRDPLFAEALHVNGAALTAVANDYSYAEAFARILKSKAQAGDILIALSTSGESKNILNTITQAKEIGVYVIGIGGQSPNSMSQSCDLYFNIPSKDTPRIQEASMLLGHIFCEEIEKNLFGA